MGSKILAWIKVSLVKRQEVNIKRGMCGLDARAVWAVGRKESGKRKGREIK